MVKGAGCFHMSEVPLYRGSARLEVAHVPGEREAGAPGRLLALRRQTSLFTRDFI